MRFDMSPENRTLGYKLLTATVTPRPIAWITSLSEEGVLNAAPYSFFNVMGNAPPVVAVGIMAKSDGSLKDTARNIIATEEFVINLVNAPLAEAMNITCVDAPSDVSEIALAGLETASSVHVAPPRIARAPVAFECVLQNAVETGPAQMMMVGEVKAIHVADTFLQDPERGYVDTPALDLIGRMHGAGWYARRPELFELTRPTYAQLKD